MPERDYLITVVWKWIKGSPIVWGAVILLIAIFIWYKGTQIWNGVGNMIFAAKMSWQGRKVEAELNSAAEQQKAIDRTLLELAESKEALAAAHKEREIREQIFNDKTKTAKEKVAAFEAAMSADPVHTDPSGITTVDLCARAKAIGSSAATIAALCGQ